MWFGLYKSIFPLHVNIFKNNALAVELNIYINSQDIPVLKAWV